MEALLFGCKNIVLLKQRTCKNPSLPWATLKNKQKNQTQHKTHQNHKQVLNYSPANCYRQCLLPSYQPQGLEVFLTKNESLSPPQNTQRSKKYQWNVCSREERVIFEAVVLLYAQVILFEWYEMGMMLPTIDDISGITSKSKAVMLSINDRRWTMTQNISLDLSRLLQAKSLAQPSTLARRCSVPSPLPKAKLVQYTIIQIFLPGDFHKGVDHMWLWSVFTSRCNHCHTYIPFAAIGILEPHANDGDTNHISPCSYGGHRRVPWLSEPDLEKVSYKSSVFICFHLFSPLHFQRSIQLFE